MYDPSNFVKWLTIYCDTIDQLLDEEEIELLEVFYEYLFCRAEPTSKRKL